MVINVCEYDGEGSEDVDEDGGEGGDMDSDEGGGGLLFLSHNIVLFPFHLKEMMDVRLMTNFIQLLLLVIKL